MSKPVIIRMRHIRAATLCSGGSREWFRAHGFDWTDFIANGISEERLLATGDPLALRVVTIAQQEANNG